jgi:hypothetical protein
LDVLLGILDVIDVIDLLVWLGDQAGVIAQPPDREDDWIPRREWWPPARHASLPHERHL